jgi:hypothetical protein
MFIVALVTVAKLWKQPRCPTTDEQIKEMWYLYVVEFYSVIKKNEVLSFVGKWLELENIILSEVSQMLSFILEYRSKQTQQYYETLVTLMGSHVQEG